MRGKNSATLLLPASPDFRSVSSFRQSMFARPRLHAVPQAPASGVKPAGRNTGARTACSTAERSDRAEYVSSEKAGLVAQGVPEPWNCAYYGIFWRLPEREA